MTSLQTHIPAINLPEEDRAAFVMRVYQHVLAAVGAFIGFEFLVFQTGLAETLHDFVLGSGPRWLAVLGVFMVGQWFVGNAASDLTNPTRQYAGLFGSAAIYSILFAVPLYEVFNNPSHGSGTLMQATLVTILGFAILSVIAFTTRKDLSFMRPIIMWGFGIALLLIVGSTFMGWNLGTWFSVALIALSGGAILYQTQNIVRRFPGNAHVAGAVKLFGSVMTMFWYVLRLFMSRD